MNEISFSQFSKIANDRLQKRVAQQKENVHSSALSSIFNAADTDKNTTLNKMELKSALNDIQKEFEKYETQKQTISEKLETKEEKNIQENEQKENKNE